MRDREKVSKKGMQTLPRAVVLVVFLVTFLPAVLNLLGVDFGTYSTSLEAIRTTSFPAQALSEYVYSSLRGALVHTLLEWTASCIAIMTVVLAFVHYRLTKDIAVPVICIALFFSGIMDAFHTLAADRLIEANADITDLIPFTWAAARLFNAGILIIWVSLLLYLPKKNWRMSVGLLQTSVIFCGVVAYGLITYMATSTQLPQTQFPEALITRPYDAVPLVLYLIALFWIFPKYNKLRSTPFSQALILTAMVEVVVECHMVFGSSALFDAHFNIAHFLKIVSYTVPFVGLMLDYVLTYRRAEWTRRELFLQKQELERSNKELADFAYVASHDLKEPLRGINNYSKFLKEDYRDKLDDSGVSMLDSLVLLTNRLQSLIDDLLRYSRIGKVGIKLTKCDLNLVIEEVKTSLQSRINEGNVIISIAKPLPIISCDKIRIVDVYINLISNSIKYNTSSEKIIEIGVLDSLPEGAPSEVDVDNAKIFYVKDNGIGIAEKHFDNIFLIFKRLHSRNKYGGGTGAGLTIVQKIIAQHKGAIWLESEPEVGTTFYFTLEV
ncbi:MAG: hypothetical protein COC19_06575 [SAR86 cluster bacterium]|uniref:histidine kinase n=1 Tax=SAR86 cluster bacterium TaxID=2030880 RepID=A0A2A4MJ20_9GAMM|nr:MAG: hypothetical protein COC19_06575 [SAR86 cluster bacterium]